jgi:hypothetical protein
MLTLEKRFVSVGEIWFDQEPPKLPVDAIQYRQRSTPIAGTRYEEFYTILIDLTKDADALLAAMDRDNMHQIKRAAAKDDLVYECCGAPTCSLISQFCDFYDGFALQKGLEKICRATTQTYADCGVLCLSRMKTNNEETLVWHSYYCSPDRVRCLNSASRFRDSDNSATRNLVGRANRYHHWCDMLKFKADGVSTYDFGGWYSGSQDEAKLRINRFKEGFGGTIVMNFNGEYGVTLKGKLYLRMRGVEPLRHALYLCGFMSLLGWMQWLVLE